MKAQSTLSHNYVCFLEERMHIRGVDMDDAGMHVGNVYPEFKPPSSSQICFVNFKNNILLGSIYLQ